MEIALLKSHLEARGGLEKYTHRLARAFADKGCTVTLLTTTREKTPHIEGVNVISLGRSSKFTLYHLLHFDDLCQKWLRDHPQERIFGMERTTHQTHYRAGSGVHHTFLKRRALVEPSWKWKLNPLHHTLLHLEKKAFENPQLQTLFTNSHMVRDEIIATYATSPEKINVVHNGVEWHAWEEPFQTRGEKEYDFLFVGHGYKRKGLPFLLQGLAELGGNSTLAVVGKEKKLSYFKEKAKNLGLEKRVTFFGPQPSAIPFLQKSSTLVIPSLYDPFANVTVEALAMGLFVVSSPYNGGKEVLTPDTGALIGRLTSPESVAEALKKALDTPKNPQKIRDTIKMLDFSHQLAKIVDKTLK